VTEPDETTDVVDAAAPAVADDDAVETDTATTDEAADAVADEDAVTDDAVAAAADDDEAVTAAADDAATDEDAVATDEGVATDEVKDDAVGDDLDDLLGLAGADDVESAATAEADADTSDDTEATETTEDDADDADAPVVDEAPARRRRPESMEDVRDRRDLIRLAGDWFVVHTYSGYEQRVKDNLTNRIEALAAEDRIFELVIPTEEVTEFKKGKKQVSEKKFLPGYVLIRMELDDETWNIVRHTPAVTGFVGATASKPVPLSLREVAATLKIPDRLEETVEGEEPVEETKPQVREIDLEEGETVRVTTGPFADFTGTIAEINLDQAKLRVMVSVFGRETPLEMPFEQVAKIT